MLLPELTRARLLRRYKRFLADVAFDDGREETAHVANPGAMMGLSDPGLPVWLSKAGPGRKLGWSMHLVEADGGLVGVDTSFPNKLAEEAILTGRVPELGPFESLRREVRYGEASRIDILLERGGAPPLYVEVKNVHLRRRGDLAEFPDCTAARSAKHMDELARMVAQGAEAAVLFVIQREDCRAFSPAADIDPAFAAALRRANEAGVRLLAYRCAMSTAEIRLDRPVGIVLPPAP